jgi:hypothetical protein
VEYVCAKSDHDNKQPDPLASEALAEGIKAARAAEHGNPSNLPFSLERMKLPIGIWSKQMLSFDLEMKLN